MLYEWIYVRVGAYQYFVVNYEGEWMVSYAF
jgi:hypothetical protein